MQKKILRIGAIVAAAVALLLVVGFLILKSIIDPNMFKPQLAGMVQKITGLNPTFAGDVSVGLFPVALRFDDVTLDSGAGPEGKPLVVLKRLDVNAELSPLLRGEVKVNAVTLEGLRLSVLRDAKGNINLPRPPVKEVTADDQSVKVITDEGETLTFSYRISGLSVTDAEVLFVDEVTGGRYEVKKLELKAKDVTPDKEFPVSFNCEVLSSKPDLRGKLSMEGEFMANPVLPLVGVKGYTMETVLRGAAIPVEETGATIKGSAVLDGARKLFTLDGLEISVHAVGGRVSGERRLVISWPSVSLDQQAGVFNAKPLQIKSNEFAAILDLQAKDLLDDPKLTCGLDIPTFSPRAALQGQGIELNLQDADTLKTASLKAVLEASAKALVLNQATLVVDDSTAVLDAGWNSDTRKGEWKLRLDKLDLDRYLPKAKTKDKAGDKAGKTEQGASKEVSKKAPLPDALQQAVIKGQFTCESLKAARLAINKIKADIHLDKGRLTTDVKVGDLYKGTVKTDVSADLTKAEPPLSVNTTVDKVSLEPMLKDLSGKAQVSGQAFLSAKLKAKGLDVDAMKRSLNGNLQASARNGALLGYTLSLDALQSGKNLDSGMTKYESAVVKADIKDGLATVKSIDVRAKPNKATGSGWVNLVKETLDLNLKAHLFNLAAIPVHIGGNLRSPSFSMDASALLEGSVKSLLEAPGDAAKGVGNILDKSGEAGKGVTDSIGGFLKGLGD